MTKFFVDDDSDVSLEADNDAFWEALLSHVSADVAPGLHLCALDVGCHRGGLVERIAKRWPLTAAYGIEPYEPARLYAERRLRALASTVAVVTPAQWDEIPSGRISLLTCHEALYLIEDREGFFAHVRRVLAPDGLAYVVHGCHPESPVWKGWSVLLEQHGVVVHEHPPLGVLESASAAGLSTSIRPLRRDGWIRYDPSRAQYRYASIAQMFEHHYRQKLLFRMVIAP